MTKRWVAAFAIAAATVSLPASAWAKDPSAQALIADGDLDRARASLVAALGEEISAEERAAQTELMVIVERWSTTGSRPHARVASADTAIAESDDWNASFSAAREALVVGRYRAAAARFAALSKSAPDAPSRARSETLARLAQAIEAHDHAPAAAAAPASAPADGGETKKEWYGWQTLICDGTSVVTSPILIGIGGYFFCAPIVHLAHGQPIHALASFGTRFSAPLTLALGGGLLDVAVQDGRCNLGCGAVGAVVGLGLGIATAIALDAAVIARKDAPRTEKKATVVPMGNAQSGRLEFGVAGTF